MSNLFNLDNPIAGFLEKLFDIMMVSVIWLILCIPVITIIPSTSALYYTVVKSIRRNRGYVVKGFFHSLKENLKVGSAVSVLIIFLALLFYFNTQLTKILPGSIGTAFHYAYYTLAIILSCMTVYAVPILSRFQLNTLQLLKMSLLLSIRHLPSTIVLLIIVGACALATYILPVFAFILPGFCCYLTSILMERILKKYTPKKEETEGKDEWYLE